jgi:hypothetical protein
MGKKLHWIREAFSRTIIILHGEKEIGKMFRRALISYDMEATLNESHLHFDVKGFVLHTVDIIDLNQNNKTIGVITFSFGRKAELTLATGERYLWRRQNFLMRNWSLVKEAAGGKTETVYYERIRRFFAERGDINESLDTSHEDLLVLTCLFIGAYFLRRKRIAGAGAV